MRARDSNICLVTAVTESYVPGALVTIGSFLRHHPRFDGDIVVLHDGLSTALRSPLEMLSDRVRCEPVSNALRERLARLVAARPGLGARTAQLFCLDAFRMTGYAKILLCDCDLLFRRSIDELFDRSGTLLCCGDGPFLSGHCRDATTFRPVAASNRARCAAVLERTFNSGFMLIDPRLTGARRHADLLGLVDSRTWRDTDIEHTDQLLLNRYLAGRQTLISSTYNYLLPSGAAILAREGLAARDAKVLHFNLGVKPWMPQAMLRWARGESGARPIPEFTLWYEACVEYLSEAHLRAVWAVARRRKGTR